MTGDYPRTVTHVGVAVTDVERAMEWYEDVLDFEVIMEPRGVERGEGLGWERASDLLGVDFERVRIGHMATGNQVGFELFEFAETPPETETDPRDGGFFHVSVIDPDLEGLAQEIDESGGDHYSDVWTLGGDDVRATYCRDPWGNRIEIYTQSYERFQVAAAIALGEN